MLSLRKATPAENYADHKQWSITREGLFIDHYVVMMGGVDVTGPLSPMQVKNRFGLDTLTKTD